MNPNSSKDFPNNPIQYFLLGASVAVQNASSVQNGSATDPAIRYIFFGWLISQPPKKGCRCYQWRKTTQFQELLYLID